MARPILIFGHPASGKSYSFKSLNPENTIIIDVDNKGALPWRGFKKLYNSERKNFFSIDTLDRILKSLKKINSDDFYKNISVIGIDGFNNALANEELFYDDWFNTKNKFEKYQELAKKTKRIISFAQNMRDNLNIIFTAHVECSDPNSISDVDHVFTPGKQLQSKYKLEGAFNYVFYAKIDNDGNHIFETSPNNSTAKSSEGCFPPTIPNDLQFVIDTINQYELGGSD